jgi:ABC-type uncharacterized transport system permease subunit
MDSNETITTLVLIYIAIMLVVAVTGYVLLKQKRP